MRKYFPVFYSCKIIANRTKAGMLLISRNADQMKLLEYQLLKEAYVHKKNATGAGLQTCACQINRTSVRA
jgi:hypothetical protein